MWRELIFTITAATFLSSVNAKLIIKNNSQPARKERIISGNEVDIESYPYQVSISKDGKHHCGGSIIKPHLILTASLCVIDGFSTPNHNTFLSPSRLTVRSGSTYKNKGGVLSNVSKIIPHEEFFRGFRSEDDFDIDWLGFLILKHDIAILILGEPLIYSTRTQEIPLRTHPLEDYNTGAFISGWGIYEKWPDKKTDTLRDYKIQAHGERFCTPRTTTEKTICADTGIDVGVCWGDTGGPLTVSKHLAGIISSIPDNCGNRFGQMYFTSIWSHKDWIEQKIVENTITSDEPKVENTITSDEPEVENTITSDEPEVENTITSDELEGEVRNIELLPHQVLIKDNGKTICGGSIISRRHVLTAAHCLGNHKSLTVRSGRKFSNQSGVITGVKDIVCYEDCHKLRDFHDDIAILTLTRDLVYNDLTQKIPLMSRLPRIQEEADVMPNLEAVVGIRQRCFLYGKIDLPCVVPSNMNETCSGIDGGSLIVDGQLAGIMVLPPKYCDNHTLSMSFTPVSLYKKKILQVIEDNN